MNVADDRSGDTSVFIPRREFLRMLGVVAGAAGLSACEQEWLVPARLVDLALQGPGKETFQNTICGLCEGGCGITVRLVDGVPVGLRGNPRHPLNRGGMCPVGQAGLEVLFSPGRLRNPLRREGDDFGNASWANAIDTIGAGIRALHQQGAGHRLAILTGEPGLLLHDLTLQFARALGSANVARTGAAPTAGYALTQGLQDPPGFDLEGSDVVISFGLDLYEDGPAPLHVVASTVGARSGNGRAALLHVGTRLSPSASKAELHVPVRPGTHAAFALGVAHVLVREGNVDHRFLDDHTFGYRDWTDESGRARLGFRRYLLENYYPDRAARLCGCEPSVIVRVARRLAEADRPVALSGGEVATSDNATYTTMAVHALNALLGSFDRRGGVVVAPPIPLRPLPPGPEPHQPSCFAPRDASLGKDPIAALAEGVLDGSYPIDLLIVMNADPVQESPYGERLALAMERIETVVVCAPVFNETAAHASWVLPTPTYLESWHDHTTPPGVPFSVLGLGQPVVDPLFDTRHPGDILLGLASTQAQVTDTLSWRDFAEYLRERLEGLVVSGQGSVISGSFEESWVHFLEERGWRFLEHDDVESFWEDLARESGWWNPVRTRGDWARMFPTPSGRFEFFSRRLERTLREIGSADGELSPDSRAALDAGIAALGLTVQGDEACLPHFEPPRPITEGDLWLVPFRPITARGRLGVQSPMLMEMFGHTVVSGWQTWAEIAPDTARELDLHDGDTVLVESERASIEAPLCVHPGAVPGVVHVAVGLGRREGEGVARAIGANPLEIVRSAPDPFSGAASLCSTRVRLRLVRRRPHGGPPPMHGGHA